MRKYTKNFIFQHKNIFIEILALLSLSFQFLKFQAGPPYGSNFDENVFVLENKVFSVFSHADSEYHVYFL